MRVAFRVENEQEIKVVEIAQDSGLLRTTRFLWKGPGWLIVKNNKTFVEENFRQRNNHSEARRTTVSKSAGVSTGSLPRLIETFCCCCRLN